MPVVSMRIEVDEKGAISSIQQIGGEFKKIEPSIKKSGQQGNLVFTEMSNNAKKARESTELLSRTLGIEIPRGLQKILAATPAVSGALATLFRASVVLAFLAAVVAVVNSFDEMKNKIMDAGYQLSIFGERVRNLVGLGNKDLIQGDEAIKINRLLVGLADRRTEAMRQQAVLGKEGFEAIRAQAELQKKLAQDMANKAGNDAVTQFRGSPETMKAALASIQQALKATMQSIDQESQVAAAALARNITLAMKQSQMEINKIGKQGIDLILQEESDAIALIPDLARKGQVNAAEASVQAHKKATAQIIQLHKDMHEQIDQLARDAASANADGYLRVERDTENKIAVLRKQFTDKFGSAFIDDPNNPENIERYGEWLKAERDLQDGIKIIRKQGDTEMVRLHREAMNEIVQAESDAAVASLPEWQRGEAQIIAEHKARVEAIRQQLSDQVRNEEEARRLIAAADAKMNAQLVDEHKRMAEQLGSDLESVFDDIANGNIGKRILANMKKLFLMIVASWMQSVGAMKNGAGNVLSGLLLGGSYLNALIPGFGGSGTAMFGGGSVAQAGISTAIAAAGGGSVPASGSLASLVSTPGGLNFAVSSAAQTASIASGGGGILSASSIPGGRASSLAGIFAPSIGPSKPAGSLLGNIVGLGMTGGTALAGMFGGNSGSLGAMLLATTLMGGKAYSAMLRPLMGMGLSGAAASGVLAGLGGGLLGFGIGNQYGKLGGGLSGGLSGLIGGLAMGGPVGAIIGGAIGLFGGLFGGIMGGARREKQANQIAWQATQQIKQIVEAYKNYQSDFGSTFNSLDQLQTSSRDQLNELRGEGRSVWQNKLQPAFSKAFTDIGSWEAERNRRAKLEFGLPMFHSGGLVGREMAQRTFSRDEVLSVLKVGERVMNEKASAKYGSTLDAMNAGVAAGNVQLTINAVDARSFQQWLKAGGAKEIRKALRDDGMEGRF